MVKELITSLEPALKIARAIKTDAPLIRAAVINLIQAADHLKDHQESQSSATPAATPAPAPAPEAAKK